MESIFIFGLAIALGYFVLPRLLSLKTLHFFLGHATSFEAAWRDRFFRPLTMRMMSVSPNLVSIFGFVLILFLLYLFSVDAPVEVIFVLVLLAGFTDMLDGPLARNNNRVTKTGAVLDWTRDLSLALAVGYFLFDREFLEFEILVWFFLGWVLLGILRVFELRIGNGGMLNLDRDYKFILDRIRLAVVWIGVLFLLLMPYNISLGRVGENLVIASIAISWFSLLFHAAHLRILRKERV